MYIKRIDTKTSGTEYTVQKYIHPCIVNLFLTKKEIQFYVGRMVFAVVLEQVTTIWEKKKMRVKEMGKEEEEVEKEEENPATNNTFYLVQKSPQNGSQI